ncbi:MAG: cryptochrome/photolyase family protein [Aliifodinibius sp.]|nr:cryptochrome/photolyase family protein [Fodinibius sp.]
MSATVWILGDQLVLNHPALTLATEQFGKDNIYVLMIESEERARRYRYHQKKLVLIFSAMRHYAEELRTAGFNVDYRIAAETKAALQKHIQEYSSEEIIMMEASEYRGRKFQEDIEDILKIPATLLPNIQFLVGRYQPFPDGKENKRYIHEQFYRKMRVHFDILMQPNGNPIENKWNFDKSNRRRLPKDAQPPLPFSFEPDDITFSVMEEVEKKFRGIGSVRGFNLAVSRKQAQKSAEEFFSQRLPNFGAFEDAMSNTFDTIYHSKLSPYINLGLLDPLELAKEAENKYHSGQAPINSVEGFIRQIIGWREYIYWQYWRLGPSLAEKNYWQANRPLPEVFWSGDIKMHCLHKVISRVLESGYSHHIERLMIIANFCLLAGIQPTEVNEWFLSTYIDSYEWVMLPNVLGMGLYADGGEISSKPYIASANYINKMGDYCLNCSYDRKQRTGDQACPFNYLYWNFILKEEEKLRSNPRMSRSLLGLRNLDKEQRIQLTKNADEFLKSLA